MNSKPRSRRVRPTDAAEPIAAAALLLKAIGVRPLELLTVAQAAELAGVTEETVRSWCRNGSIGQYDRQLKKYLIDKAELREFLLCHWRGRLPARFDSASTQVPSVLSFSVERLAMTDSDPTRQLLPHEKFQLEHLLKKLGGPSLENAAQTASELAAEQRKLERRRAKLAEQEAATAAHLSELRSALDEVTTRLDKLLASRPGTKQDIISGSARPGTLVARRELRRFTDHLRAMLAQGQLESLSREQLTDIVEGAITSFVNPRPVPPPPPTRISLEQYAGLTPAPPPAASEASSLADRMERQHLFTNAELTAEEKAAEIVRVGRKYGSPVLIDEPDPPPTAKRSRH